MKRFILAVAVIALTATASEACVARGARSGVRTKTVTRSTARVGFTPVRTVLTPFRTTVVASPCVNGKCPAVQSAASVAPTVIVPIKPVLVK
jgi:hypothetical protein